MRKTKKLLIILGCSIGVLWFFSYAFCDVTTFKSSVVWRVDTKGSYRLPDNLPAGKFEAKEVIYTDGDITSITANWQFSGRVTLEVSADNGNKFVPAINGVPVTLDFLHSGRSIKWRADIEPDSKLTLVNVSYTDKAGVSAGFGNPLLCGFKYRKLIKLSQGPMYQSLFNYQMQMKIGESAASEDADVHCEGNIRADFKDVRFTCLDGDTLLPYYIEKIEGIWPNRSAVVWVKVPQISSGGVNIYIYYGNAAALDASCGEDVFDFFDDFENEQLDSGKWQVRQAKDSTYNIADSRLELYDITIVSKTYRLRDGILEYSAALQKGGKIELIVRGEDVYNQEKDKSQSIYSSVYDRLQHCIVVGDNIKVNDTSPISLGTKYGYRVIADGPDLSFTRYNDGFTEEEAQVTFSDSLGPQEGYIGLCSVIENGHNKVYYDWVRVRKYAPAEPQVMSGTKESKQEEVELPVFVNTDLSAKGSVILKDSNKPGLYIPARIRSAFDVRILIAEWEGESVFIDVSTDGGVNFKKDCVNAAYYYAASGDFVSGKDVLANARLSPAQKDSDSSAGLWELTLKGSPGIISVVVPNGGEVFQKESSKDILWSALDYEDSYGINLEYSLDAGSTFNTIAQRVKNTGSFLWMVSDEIASSSQVKIKVSDANDPAVFDLSDNVFEIMDKKEVKKKESKKAEETTWGDWLALKGKKTDSINMEAVISGGETIVTNSNIKFKKLVIGDGKGVKKTKLILNNNIDAGSTDIIIRKGGELIQANNQQQAIKGSLIIEPGGGLTHERGSDSLQYQINFSAGNIIIKEGAVVTADGKGFAGGSIRQQGKGKGAGKYASKIASGGSHGGRGGGKGAIGKSETADTYGTTRSPQTAGSGGAGSWVVSGGSGGGIIWLSAEEVFSISGRISANGEDGGVSPENQFDGAGGAGGSVYLSAGEFSGEGAQITASGGSGHVSAGGGAGGRIYLKAPAGGITGTMNVNGGDGFEKGKGGSLIVE